MTALISNRKVPPSGPEDAEILIIGEAPGYEEDKELIPFIGDAGKELNRGLAVAGFDRNNIRVTNVCNYRPNNNKFELLEDTWQLQEGINDVKEFIETHKSTLKFVVLCGGKPLEYIGRKHGIDKWRSSVIEESGVKFFCSYHPSAIIRDRSLYSTFTFDFRKLYRYVKEGYRKPEYRFNINPTGTDREEALRELESHGRLYIDIESVKGTTHILCCGFASSPTEATVFSNSNFGFLDFEFHSSLSRILENPKIEKFYHNGFGYDIEVLRLNGINVQNYVYDTMIGAHVLEPELPYSLAYLTTLYTDQAYYKDKGKSAIPDDEEKGWSEKVDRQTLYEYNATDCVVTAKVAIEQIKEINERKLWRTYNYKASLIPLGQELSRNGLEVFQEQRELLREAVKLKWKYYQEILNGIAGFKVNAKSPKHMTKLLLEQFGLPERRNRNAGITFDEDAIVSYFSFIQAKIDESKREATIEQWTLRLAACKCILLIRGFRQLISNYVKVKISSDNRLRSVYNLSAATETGRGSSHKWVDGTGLNAQTFPRERLELDDFEVELLKKKGFLL